MSANFDDNVSGPFDGPFDQPDLAHEGGHDDYRDEPGSFAVSSEGAKAPASGLELVGGVLFLAGFIPAAAVAKALVDGTNLEAAGLGGTAALAATVSKWLGAWPALVTAAAIGIIGSLMVLGALRTDPLRRVAGLVVSGLGLAAIAGALTSSPMQGLLGAGGRIGSGTGGAMADSVGVWAGVLLGLLVMGGALWLGFGPSAPAIDEDDGMGPIVERGESTPRAPGQAAGQALGSAAAWAAGTAAAVGAAGAGLFKRQPRSESEVVGHNADRQRRVSNKKLRRTGAPVTLGDALARGGTEGVSHDEAAALAPDENTLAYMEDVWRRASHTIEQPDPIPKSPYPEDVRLKGMIPEGAAPLQPRRPEDLQETTSHSVAGAPAEPTPPPAPAPSVTPVPVPNFGPPSVHDGHGQGQEVAPFDFEDELSAPQPLDSPPPPVTLPIPTFQPHAADPFGTPAPSGSLTDAEADAYRDAVLREGASAQGPSELPDGVKPFTPKPVEGETPLPAATSAAELSAAESSAATTPEAPLPELPSVSFSRPENDSGIAPAGGDPMAVQAMQAGAMPASVSLPPRPAWEQGYDDHEPSAELAADALQSIPEVDDQGRWQRREEGAAPEAALELDEGSMSALDELLAEVDHLESVDLAGTVSAEPETSEIEAEIEAEPEAEAELEVEAEFEPEVEEEVEVEAADDEGDEEDEEAEYEEYEEDAEDEELEADEESAELEEDGEEEYEYVDEDGNPIDPADLGEDYELVDEEEGEEEAEYEEYDEDEADEYEEGEEDEDEAAEYEEEEPEEDEGEEDAEYEEFEDEVMLEPKAPPAAVTAAEPFAEALPAESSSESPKGDLAGAISEPQPTSVDGSRLREAGRLVVSVDRAAVSVIQKGFDVEFAEACTILEELHAEGLIGPYQEGKKRAILMSLDEWDSRFAHS